MITPPALSALTASASPLATSIAAGTKAAATEVNLFEQWEGTRRDTEQRLLKERLETAEKIAQALQPMLVGALSSPGGSGARQLASALESLSKEVRDITRSLHREFKHQAKLAGEGIGQVSPAFHDLLDKAQTVIDRTSGMLIAVGSNDRHPPGQLSARDIAERAARNILVAKDDLQRVSVGMTTLRIPRVDVTV